MRKPDLDEFDGCCEGTGHADGCESREPAHDIGDLICRAPCAGCCSEGHKPQGLQAMQDQTGIKARMILGGYPPGWPRCPGCGRPALDGHITCGNAVCNESERR